MACLAWIASELGLLSQLSGGIIIPQKPKRKEGQAELGGRRLGL
jgi:hypothetical protein